MHLSISVLTSILAASTLATPILPIASSALATAEVTKTTDDFFVPALVKSRDIEDVAEALKVEERQVSPWPHFRECRKNDPRPYCPKKGVSSIKRTDVFGVEARQVSPWPHFRECRKNDPRPYCPKKGSFVSERDVEEAEVEIVGDALKAKERQVSPSPHFRECRKDGPRPYCPLKNSASTSADIRSDEHANLETRQGSPWPHFRECRRNDPRPYCPNYNAATGEVEFDAFWEGAVGQEKADWIEGFFESFEDEKEEKNMDA